MATETIYFTGMAKWAKVYKPDDKYGNYQINLYLDEVNKDKFIKSGVQLHIRKDEDGEFVVLKRPEQKLMKKELVHLGPPKVIDKDNQEFNEMIGNGSIVTCKVQVYDTIKGKGHRLETVRVEDWVEYKKPTEEGASAASVAPGLPF